MSSTSSKQNRMTTAIAILVGLIAIVLLALLLKELVPVFLEILKDTNDESVAAVYIRSYGAASVPVLIILQIFQVVSLVFPATPLQILIGLMYGIWWGALISFVGFMLGNTITFVLARKGGAVFDRYFARVKKKSKESIFSPARIDRLKHPGLIIVVLSIMPGLPNGLLPFVYARTKMSLWRFTWYSAIGCIPTLFIGVGLGSVLSKGNITLVAILTIVLLLITGIVFLFREKIFRRLDSLED